VAGAGLRDLFLSAVGLLGGERERGEAERRGEERRGEGLLSRYLVFLSNPISQSKRNLRPSKV